MREIHQARYVMGTVVEIVADACCENPPLRGEASVELRETSWRSPQRDIPLHPLQRGNQWTDQVRGASGLASHVAAAVCRALDCFEILERKFSCFDPESELSQVNRLAATKPVHVSAEFFRVVLQGIKYSRRSEGAFSIALASLIRLWRKCAAQKRWATKSEIRAARLCSDFRFIRLNQVEQTIYVDAPGVGLDLGGLVKGYAVDQARQILRRSGVSRALINAGNSSLSAITPVGGSPHAIGLRAPHRLWKLAGSLWLRNESVSTSGSYERGWNIEGKSRTHLIDPRSGVPLGRMSGATVVCGSAMLAEVASKMLLFHGCQHGIALCERNGWRVAGAVLEERASREASWMEQSDDFPFRPIMVDLSLLASQRAHLNR